MPIGTVCARVYDDRRTGATCGPAGHPDNGAMDSPRQVKVALAHHWLVSMRGGEKFVAALAELFPQAPIYTLLVRPENLTSALAGRQYVTSCLQRLSAVPDLQRRALPVLALAARRLDASAYDVVICSDAATIKAVHTRPDALKICYCHSPMRYVWDLYEEYRAAAGPLGRLGLRLFGRRLRRADAAAAETVDAFVANSREVAERIGRSYGRSSVVIPPPVEMDAEGSIPPPEDFYLVLGELVQYKRCDLAVDACNQLGRQLVVIGDGPLRQEIERRAGKTVRVLGWQSDEVVRDHLRRCRALLFCGREDFGLVPVEALAAGRPVIAYAAGGALETVVDGCSGIFFDRQEAGAVAAAVERFEASPLRWGPRQLREHAAQFGPEQFRRRFLSFYQWCLELHATGGRQRVRDAMERVDRDAFTGNAVKA